MTTSEAIEVLRVALKVAERAEFCGLYEIEAFAWQAINVALKVLVD